MSDAPASLTVGTAGHIDHGKTALVRALTGRDTDRLEEERRRGMSIELGYAELALGERRLSLVDVPGHERFVRTMIAGATGIDLFLLVVAADDGVMPQTREHLAVLGALGVGDGVVAVTKVDLVDEDARPRVEAEVEELLPGTETVQVSARTGEGIDALRSSLGQLAERVDALRGAEAGDSEPVLHVDRVFTVAGHGTVVTGTLWSGTLAKGDRVVILPSGKEARVRSIESHDHAAEAIGPRRRVALNLVGVQREEVERGDVVTVPGASVEPTYRLDVDLPAGTLAAVDQQAPAGGAGGVHRQAPAGGTATAVDRQAPPGDAADRQTLAGDAAAKSGRNRSDIDSAAVAAILGERRVQVHHGTRESPARVVDLGDGAAQLRLERPLLARRGERVVIRRIAPPDTLGGGLILDPSPPRHSDRSKIGVSSFGCSATKSRRATGERDGRKRGTGSEAGAPAEPSALALRLLAELEADGERPRTPAKLAEDLEVPRREVERALGELVEDGAAVRVKADVVYPAGEAARLGEAIAALATREGSTSIAEVRDALGLSRKYAQALLEHLNGERVLRRDGDRHYPRGAPK